MKSFKKLIRKLNRLVGVKMLRKIIAKQKKFIIIGSGTIAIVVLVITLLLINAQGQPQNNVISNADDAKNQTHIPTLSDDKAPTLSNDKKTESKKIDTGGEPDAVENTVEPGIMPSTYVTPDFHIRTPLSMSVPVGGQVGPFTAYTSDGSAVDWQTPDSLDGTGGVYGYSLKTMPRTSKSLEYYIHANNDVKPGTYYIYISAHKQQNPPMMTSIQLKVTVTPSPTFVVDVNWSKYTISDDTVSVPYTVRRYNGFSDDISIMAYYTDPNSSDPVGSGYNETIHTNVTSGIIKMYLPDGEYRVTVQTSNYSGQDVVHHSHTINKIGPNQ